ncbi:hypothetical protein Tco_0641517 [Tanacetum coccineum]
MEHDKEHYLLTLIMLFGRKNESKAKSTLLLAIPDEHLLKFHGIKDAKTLWEAIKAMFGGNKESKKMQKTILKQQYENFTASRSEGLNKTYDRFQKLISQLEIHGEVISQEDANLKLLRSLPSAWNNISLIMRNKSDLDTLSMDDLYNNLKKLFGLIRQRLNVTTATGEVTLLENARHQGIRGIEMEMLQEGLYQWRLLQNAMFSEMVIYGYDLRAFRLKRPSQTLL